MTKQLLNLTHNKFSYPELVLIEMDGVNLPKRKVAYDLLTIDLLAITTSMV